MSFFLPKSVEPIYIHRRKGDQTDPFTNLSEEKVVNVQRVFLTEIPDRTNGVTVTDNGTQLVESSSTTLSSGQYYVDYNIGIAYFHADEDGKTLNFDYLGTGIVNFPATRINLQDSNGDVSKTLQAFHDEIVANNKTANDSIDTMNQVVADTNDAKNNANAQAHHAQIQGDYAKSVGDNVKTNWLAPVVSFTDVENTYTSPTHGDTVMTTNFNHSDWNLHSNVTVNSSKKITLNATSNAEASYLILKANENTNYLISAKHNAYLMVKAVDSSGTEISRPINYTTEQSSKFTTPTGTAELWIYLSNNDLGSGTYTFEETSLYKISQETYDKIGVSYTDSDVERLFPYVDSVQHVENPDLSVEGDNLNGDFYGWDSIHSNAEITTPYELTLNATSTGESSYTNIEVVENQAYTISLSHNAYFDIIYYDNNGSQISNEGNSTAQEKTFTTPSNTKEVRIWITNGGLGSGTYTFSNIMLNLGSTAKPFVERNPSYLMVQTTLAGNSVEKDI